ncbi:MULTISPECIES: DUF1574 family protein [unclassified Coleofasciculus]|uniref:DUF1574 family protein n=1 Tax=unclassified Coleofasciculus TaxID=2692782 RepID=UPI001882A34C|nr:MULTISPECIES: DUF1574 family protein [unclassified Coleofasciculus]MBE9128735.1 DUF1574 family protein [Coleofasciculus sp. LEGE 07081]MBE9151815.1 DUF1574 family protein [Coleofasciculus sp. LEGE 07092]
MLDVDQRNLKDRPSSLAQWAYDVIGQPGVYLRVRLRGNNLHILCESHQALAAHAIVNRFLKALKVRQGTVQFPIELENPIYQITIYGRRAKNPRPDWIKHIRVKATSTDNTNASLVISNESLARSGSPEAIARYLSANLSHLGVSVKVLIQELGAGGQFVSNVEPNQESYSCNRRLWVVCTSNYSPDLSLLAEPLVEQLRALQLKEFRDAAVCAQVSGETNPEWTLRVDLTPAEEMLEDWACWGDVQAIARILDRELTPLGMQVRAFQKEATLHLFCLASVDGKPTVPDKPVAVNAIAPVLESIAPQGIKAAAIYGVESDRFSLELEPEKPLWVDWLNLSTSEEETLSAFSLAQQGKYDALTFLLERLLNPDLDRWLATGGIHLKIRRKDDLLHIMSEAPLCPSQVQVGPPIARFLRQLALPNIAGVRIYGRRTGVTSPSWNYGVDFVARRRLVPEATPEFAASDACVSDLVAPPGESVLRPDLTENDLKEGLQKVSQGIVRTIQHCLCYSQLFIPTLDNKALSVRRSGLENSQGAKVAMVWGILGLLLTFQADWLMGQLVRSRTNFHRAPTSAATEGTPASMSLPQLSLQRDSNWGADNFNGSGFTREGATSIIIDDSSTSERVSAAKIAALAVARSPNPSFNNQLLDQKLALYQHRFLQSGPPDVLIMGSSRALRGIDPVTLQDALAAQGYSDIEVFNFGVNGATAQVVDLIIRRVLTPDQLPKLIIWADGARAFNSGRVDTTYNAIASSDGYQQLNAGTFPNRTGKNSSGTNSTAQPLAVLQHTHQALDETLNHSLGNLSSAYSQRDELKSLLRNQFVTVLKQAIPQAPTPPNPEEALGEEEFIDFDGFLPLSARFDPAKYYQNHPRVKGAYDSNYQSFQLRGEQDKALESLLQFAKAHDINIVFVNLPLTQDYLDPVRSNYEKQFQQYMHTTAIEQGLIFRDLSDLLLNEPDYFSDPSHLNRYGAYEVSNYLAQDPMIPWSLVVGN